MRAFKHLAVLALGMMLLVVAGCKGDPEVSGQVFVTFQSGQALKLGGIKVMAVPRQSAETQLRPSQEEINERLRDADKLAKSENPIEAERLKVVESEIEAIEKERAQLLQEAKELTEKLRTLSTRYTPEQLAPISSNIASKESRASAIYLERDYNGKVRELGQLRNSGSARAALLKEASTMASGRQKKFPSSWKDVVAQATTDADGRFSMKLPAGQECVLIAETLLSRGTSQQLLRWIVPVDSQGARDFHLNSQNLSLEFTKLE